MQSKEKLKDLIRFYLGVEGKEERVERELKSFCVESVKIPLKGAAATLDAMRTKEGYAVYYNIFKSIKSKDDFLHALREILRLNRELSRLRDDYE